MNHDLIEYDEVSVGSDLATAVLVFSAYIETVFRFFNEEEAK